jgi:hypothetical protein
MGLFRRPAQEAAASGPAPAQMRGLAVEITDPGLLRWEVVWEALKTEPPADEPSTITQELGLHEEREIAGAYNADRWGTEFSGTRHGRHVALRIGVVPSIRGKAFNEVHVAASVSPFRLRADDGRIVADPGASPALQQLLAELAPAPKTWRQLEVEGSADEIVARRPVTAHSQGYVYDLWLVERLADRLGS